MVVKQVQQEKEWSKVADDSETSPRREGVTVKRRRSRSTLQQEAADSSELHQANTAKITSCR